MRSMAAHRAASAIDDSRPTAIRLRKAAPSAAPSATPDTSTGRPVASAMARSHGSTRVPPPAATMRDSVHPAQFDELADDEAGRLVGGSAQRRRVVGEVQAVEHPATVGVVEGCALATQVGRPHRHSPRIHHRRVARPQHPVDPAEKQPAGIARSADLTLSGHGRDGPQARHLPRLGDGDPDDQGGAAQHQHVAVVVGAGHHLLAQRVDGADRQHGAGLAQLPGSDTGCFDPGHPVDRHTAVRAGFDVPAGRRTAATRCRRWESRPPPHPPARNWRPPAPASTRPHRALGRPSSAEIRRPRPPGTVASPSCCRHPAPVVAVQQPRRDRMAAGVDGGQRRHHRGNGHRQRIRARQLLQRRQRTQPPRLVGVVFQPVRRRHSQLVRDACPRDHPAILVGGHRFDGGGADVDADCDLFA